MILYKYYFIILFILLYNITCLLPCKKYMTKTKNYFNYLGETIEAKTYPDVTMLFSDIVGFTSICATTTPMMVINMLQNLYEQFDLYCGQLDVYKVRLLKRR